MGRGGEPKKPLCKARAELTSYLARIWHAGSQELTFHGCPMAACVGMGSCRLMMGKASRGHHCCHHSVSSLLILHASWDKQPATSKTPPPSLSRPFPCADAPGFSVQFTADETLGSSRLAAVMPEICWLKEGKQVAVITATTYAT